MLITWSSGRRCITHAHTHTHLDNMVQLIVASTRGRRGWRSNRCNGWRWIASWIGLCCAAWIRCGRSAGEGHFQRCIIEPQSVMGSLSTVQKRCVNRKAWESPKETRRLGQSEGGWINVDSPSPFFLEPQSGREHSSRGYCAAAFEPAVFVHPITKAPPLNQSITNNTYVINNTHSYLLSHHTSSLVNRRNEFSMMYIR